MQLILIDFFENHLDLFLFILNNLLSHNILEKLFGKIAILEYN